MPPKFIELHLERGRRTISVNVNHLVSFEPVQGRGCTVNVVAAGCLSLQVDENYAQIKALLEPTPTEEQPFEVETDE